jgi:transposase
VAAQETRAMLTARKLMQSKLRDLENSLRGILRGFGLKMGKTTPKQFEGRIKELVVGHPSLQIVTKVSLLKIENMAERLPMVAAKKYI